MAGESNRLAASTANFVKTAREVEAEQKRASAETAAAFEAIRDAAVLNTLPVTRRTFAPVSIGGAPRGCQSYTTDSVSAQFNNVDKKVILTFSYRCTDSSYYPFANTIDFNETQAIEFLGKSPEFLDTVAKALDAANADLLPFKGKGTAADKKSGY